MVIWLIGDEMKRFIRVMKALSDPSRVKIIKMLTEKELCVCEMTVLLGLAQPTVSKHLKVLEDAGLVEFWKQGSWVIYRLAAGDDSPYAKAMLAHLKDWLNEDEDIRNILKELPMVDRERIRAA
jgi:ArsR family transcriptional regulator